MEKTSSLEITVISAEGLRISSRLIKKNAFVTVRTDSHNQKSTTIDRDGGSYPSWNQKLQLALPPSTRSIAIEVHCKTGSGSKMVGTANVPMSDILEDYVPADQLRFLSYRLREQDGEPNGIVNLSIKMVGLEYVRQAIRPSEKDKCLSGIAIGIPVSYAYRV